MGLDLLPLVYMGLKPGVIVIVNKEDPAPQAPFLNVQFYGFDGEGGGDARKNAYTITPYPTQKLPWFAYHSSKWLNLGYPDCCVQAFDKYKPRVSEIRAFTYWKSRRLYFVPCHHECHEAKRVHELWDAALTLYPHHPR